MLDQAPVLDLGCGRGEFLSLLRDEGIACRGVDKDPAMIDRCREHGIEVEQGQAIDYLAAVSDDSLGAVFAGQVIEHLEHDELVELLEHSVRALRPGGVFIAETVNPHSLVARKAYWLDRTHRSPVFPEVALTLCSAAGFDSAFVTFPNGTGDLEQDRRLAGDFAVIARTIGPPAAATPSERK